MSKQIDWGQPVDEETAAWAGQFPGLHDQMLASNAEAMAPKEETLDGSDSGDEAVPYDQWPLAELQAEVKERNAEGRTPQLKATGTKAELAKVLEADDAAHPAAGQ